MQKLTLEEMAFEALEIAANLVCLGLFLAMILAFSVGIQK
jgi:hypothetical protein